jgi:hypothetical protein
MWSYKHFWPTKKRNRDLLSPPLPSHVPSVSNLHSRYKVRIFSSLTLRLPTLLSSYVIYRFLLLFFIYFLDGRSTEQPQACSIVSWHSVSYSLGTLINIFCCVCCVHWILFVLSFYKLELETEREPGQRQWLLRQLLAAETEVLNIMRADHERRERENRNMEAALERIKRMDNRRK